MQWISLQLTSNPGIKFNSNKKLSRDVEKKEKKQGIEQI
jgi:hypothetical protein